MQDGSDDVETLIRDKQWPKAGIKELQNYKVDCMGREQQQHPPIDSKRLQQFRRLFDSLYVCIRLQWTTKGY